jgi:hypothetical protein
VNPDDESRAGTRPALYSRAAGYKRSHLQLISLGSAPLAVRYHVPDGVFRRGFGFDRSQDLLRERDRSNGKTSASNLKAI